MFRVATVEPDERKDVLALMFDGLTQDVCESRTAEVLQAQRDGSLSLEGLLKVEGDAAAIKAAGFYTVQLDGTAYLWPPFLSDDDEQYEAGDVLLQEMCRKIDDAGALLAQCLVEPDHVRQQRALSRNGFEHLADLSFLQRSLERPLAALPDSPLETVVFDPEQNRRRFAELLEQTYVETLDCPKFHDLRSGDDALRSHQTAGQFDPRRWKIFRADGQDVGALLLSDHPEQDAWEVVYVGIAPEFRGRHYGHDMLLQGLHEARAAGRSSVFLAVDRQNSPATRIYRQLQFEEVGVRAVHVRGTPKSAPN